MKFATRRSMWESICVVGFALGSVGLALRPSGASGAWWAWRNRVVTLGWVGGFLGAFALTYPEPAARSQAQYLFVTTLGYGHLIGAAVFARSRMAALRPTEIPPLLFAALLSVSAATGFALYAWAGGLHTGVFVPLLAVAVWHFVENDLCLGRAYRNGFQLGPVPGRGTGLAASVGMAAIVLAAAQATLAPHESRIFLPGTGLVEIAHLVLRIVAGTCGLFLLARGSGASQRVMGTALIAGGLLLPSRIPPESGIGFSEVFFSATLYHLVSWLVFLADRTREASRSSIDVAAASTTWRRLFWVHVPPAGVCAVLVWWPDAAATSVRDAVFSPPTYLYWAVLHVLQTAWVRSPRAVTWHEERSVGHRVPAGGSWDG